MRSVVLQPGGHATSFNWAGSEFDFSPFNPVKNPSLPYTGPILGGLKAGKALFLQGAVPSKADRFAINFKIGQSDHDDIAFHFNPRLNSAVVLNSFKGGNWETEECISNNPFKAGEHFQLFIVIKAEGYEVYINGVKNSIFKHRVPLEKVTALHITGDVKVDIYGFMENWSAIGHLGLSVHNPDLPYVGPISGGINPGMAFYLNGVAGTKGDRFAINFKTGPGGNDDVAFHFNPRYNENVVMNTFRNGAWEVEEYGPDNPFIMGEPFELFIIFRPERYQVFVNGIDYCLFQHRIPLDKVSTLNIVEDVVVNNAGFIKNWKDLGFMRWGLSTILSEFSLPVYKPNLPYVGPISNGLKPGQAMYFQGVVGTTGDRFSINFKTGQSDKDDVAFHFNPRYNANVVMNTFKNGAWEAEEYGLYNPFKMGEVFEIFIVIKPEGYQVYVNGREYYLFKYRIPLEKVTTLHITGNVVINLFALIEKWSASFFATQLRGFLSWTSADIHTELSLPVQNPALPYVSLISGGLRPGLALYLQGVVGTTGDRFSVNFKTGQSDKDDVAFHFNPRYNANVVMNTFRNEAWEDEEYGPDNPFKMGEAFETFIVFKPEGYHVYVNGKDHHLFRHRIPLEKVSTLNICGDLVVKFLGFI